MFVDEFRTCIQIIKQYGSDSIQNTLDSLLAQKEELNNIKAQRKNDLKRTLFNTKTANEVHSNIANGLQTNDLPNLQGILRAQQKNNIYSRAKQVTIGRIADCNKKISQIQSTITENELKVKYSAKMFSAIIQEVDKINSQIDFMNNCIALNSYIVNVLNRDAAGISDYEVNKLYDNYSKEVNTTNGEL